ncbi:MAG TPA: Ig-like domain-containing protein, partial [Aquihabitans sp.]|nr:Ig-like domain-containing protein [Aquihabitans sp.]
MALLLRRPWALALAALVALTFAPGAFSSAAFTSASRSAGSVTAAADWTPPTVALASPGDAIRGTVNLTATASDAETGVASVVIAWAPEDSTTWTTICTRTAAPYTCPFATAGLPEAAIDLRAVATDRSGYATTALVESVLVDNVAPTGSLVDPGTTLRGSVTVAATVADAGSGVATVTIQRAPAGTTTWTTICTRTASPWSCRFDTTQVPDGSYDLRAIVTDVSGNVTTTASLRRSVDNTVSSISIEDPGEPLRGTVTLVSYPASTAGVTSVRIQRQQAGTTTWADVCTATVAPYSCAWDTTTVAAGGYSFRAILTDGSGKVTTSAVVGPRQVDNSPVRGVDVQAANSGTAGRLSAGDRIVLTYAQQMRLTSILAGWDGTARQVVVRVRDGAALGRGPAGDTLDVFTTSAFTAPVHLGSVQLNGNYVSNNTAGFQATMTQTTVTVAGVAATQVTLTLGTQVVGGGGLVRTVTAAGTMLWTPSATAV